MPHWTNENTNSFISKITFDFIAQITKRIEEGKLKQSELAQKLGISDGAVSQVLNLSRTNLNLKTMVRYARALGMKVSVVAYDDEDPQNNYGPVGSELFSDAWQKLGKPRNVSELNQQTQRSYSDGPATGVRVLTGDPSWTMGWINTTEQHSMGSARNVSELPPLCAISQEQHGGTANAGN